MMSKLEEPLSSLSQKQETYFSDYNQIAEGLFIGND